MELRIAIGIGKATGVYKRPVNLHGGGEAFLRARKAAERVKAGYPKYRLLTVFNSGNELFDTIANTIYGLQDSLSQRTTRSQWAAINARLATGRQDKTARKLKLDISTVSRDLKRGYYWQLVETARIYGAHFGGVFLICTFLYKSMKLDEMIQAAQLAFLALLLAHLVGDFLFQPKWLAENKGKRLWPLLCHGFVHYASAWACLLIFA